MRYTAKHYVNISGRMYAPGDMIDIPIPHDKIDRLLRLEAVAPMIVANVCFTEDEQSLSTEDADTAAGETDEAVVGGGEAIEEADEAEAPEIDVMDGIISDAGEAVEEVPKKNRGRKKT